MPKTSQDEKVRLGEAAENLVLSRALRLGHVAAQVPRGYRGYDLFTETGFRIQVKASRDGCSWLVGKVHPNDRLIYCLVDFEGGAAGTVYVVPSQTVWEAADAHHRTYTSRDIGMRQVMNNWRTGHAPDDGRFRDGWLEESFKERWDHLGNPEALGSDPSSTT